MLSAHEGRKINETVQSRLCFAKKRIPKAFPCEKLSPGWARDEVKKACFDEISCHSDLIRPPIGGHLPQRGRLLAGAILLS